jgi:hypothetical protein
MGACGCPVMLLQATTGPWFKRHSNLLFAPL